MAEENVTARYHMMLVQMEVAEARHGHMSSHKTGEGLGARHSSKHERKQAITGRASKIWENCVSSPCLKHLPHW
jgi:hypothetical protein